MADQGATGSKHRPYGQGSIRERSAGHYELRYYDKGRKRQATRTYAAPSGEAGKRAAQRELKRLVAEVDAGTYVTKREAAALASEQARAAALVEEHEQPQEPGRTLADLFDAWLEMCESRGREATTMRGYKLRAERYKASPLGKKPVEAITGEDIDRLHAMWVRQGTSHATVLHHFRVLRAALRQGVKWKWAPNSAASDATVTIPTQRRPDIPTPQELQQLVDRASSLDFKDLIRFAALTGARRGELAGLRWGDVDWAANLVTFQRSVFEFWENGEHKMGVKGLKSGSEKKLALDPFATSVLAARHERAEQDAKAAGLELTQDAYVWSSDTDGATPRKPDAITSSFDHITRSLAAETGDDRWHRFVFHGLRHWAATTLVAAGVDPVTAAHRLGHSDATMILRVYGHWLPERDRDAAEKLGQALALPTGASRPQLSATTAHDES